MSGITLLKNLRFISLSRLGRNPSSLEEELDQRPNILLSQFCVFGFLGALANLINDALSNSFIPVMLDLFFCILLVAIYFINESGKHNSARYIFLLAVNLVLFVYANLVPKEVGMYLIFFPLMGGTYIFLLHSSKPSKIFFVALPIIILFVLEFTEYEIFGKINLDNGDPKFSFLINLTISTIAFSIAINYLIILNQKNEKSILQNRDEFKELAEEIDEKNKILEKANLELDRFVYSTSHDLRSPLMSVLGLIGLLKIERDPGIKTKYIELIEERIHKLDSFIRDIIEYSKNTRSEVIPEKINLKDLVDNIISNHKYLANADKIHFSNEIDTGFEIFSDKQRLGMVLNNLVSNAIKYHNCAKDFPQIKLKTRRLAREVSISVEDNGTGIRETEQQKIFEMFYRGSENSDGTGLGLYIAKEMAKKLRGNLELHSKPGEGSVFTIHLPEN